MNGLDARTGRPLGGLAHLRQSIGNILTTPVGTRVMRRDYGSRLFELIDQPFNAITRQLLFAATAMALMRWEPRVRLRRVAIERGEEAGLFFVDLELEERERPGVRFSLPLSLRRGQFGLALAA